MKGERRMLLVTTNQLPENLYEIEAVLGIVHGEVIFGAHIGKDFIASLTNVFGGRSGTYENELVEARENAKAELIKRAEQLGENAVIGVDFDFEVFGEGGSMFLAIANGTAVRIREK